ncbi:MAG: hypothetical protein HY258_11585, partial [Chloroflexi bacterium]|nr:hypothetical protein [Chloroflexota bacterium]
MNQHNQVVTFEFTSQAEGRNTRPSAAARKKQDQFAKRIFSIVTLLPLLLIAGVTVALIIRSWPILSAHSWTDLLFGTIWKPNDGLFGFWPFIMGTTWVTAVGVLLAIPPCLLVALYLSEYAHAFTRSLAKPV